jgi:hypothetical protein
MSRYLPKPRGLWRLDQAYPERFANVAETPVMVSLCGASVPWDGVVLEAEPGRDYDWSRLRAFYAQILVRPGIDATRTVKALLPIAAPYLQLVDVGQWKAWSISGITPRLKGWPERMPERPETWK